MRRRGKEVSTDVTLTSRDIGELALIATLRDLSIAELVGQALAGAIKKDMIEKILRGERRTGKGGGHPAPAAQTRRDRDEFRPDERPTSRGR